MAWQTKNKPSWHKQLDNAFWDDETATWDSNTIAWDATNNDWKTKVRKTWYTKP